MTSYDVENGEGVLEWRRHVRRLGMDFNKHTYGFRDAESNEFPASEYDEDPRLPFAIDLVSPRTVRLRFALRDQPLADRTSLMIDGEVASDNSWQIKQDAGGISYVNERGVCG